MLRTEEGVFWAEASFSPTVCSHGLGLLLRQEGDTSGEARDISRIRDHVQPGGPSHSWANGEGVFFRVDSSPFVPAR